MAFIIRQVKFVVLFLLLSEAISEQDKPKPQDPLENENIPVIYHNQVKVGIPISVKRTGGVSFDIPDGATHEATMFEGEIVSITAMVEALEDVSGFGDNIKNGFHRMKLRASYRQRTSQASTIIISLEDKPPRPLSLKVDVHVTTVVDEAAQALLAALRFEPNSTNVQVEVNSNDFTVFNVPLEYPYFMDALQRLSVASSGQDSHSLEAKALLILVKISSWCEDFREESRHRMLQAKSSWMSAHESRKEELEKIFLDLQKQYNSLISISYLKPNQARHQLEQLTNHGSSLAKLALAHHYHVAASTKNITSPSPIGLANGDFCDYAASYYLSITEDPSHMQEALATFEQHSNHPPEPHHLHTLPLILDDYGYNVMSQLSQRHLDSKLRVGNYDLKRGDNTTGIFDGNVLPIMDADELAFHIAEADNLALTHSTLTQSFPPTIEGTVSSLFHSIFNQTDESIPERELAAAESAYLVAQSYEFGSNGLDQNTTAAMQYFKIAARYIRQADEALGILHFHGLGTESGRSEPEQARIYLERADTPTALTMLAEMYQNGILDQHLLKLVDADSIAYRPSPTSMAQYSPQYPMRLSTFGEKAVVIHELSNQRAWEFYSRAANEFNYPLAEVSLGVMLLQNQAPVDVSKFSHVSSQGVDFQALVTANAIDAWKHFKRAEELLFNDNMFNDTSTSPSITTSFNPTLGTLQDQFVLEFQKQQTAMRKRAVLGYDFSAVEVYHNLGFMLFHNLGSSENLETRDQMHNKKHKEQCRLAIPYLSKAARHILWYAGASSLPQSTLLESNMPTSLHSPSFLVSLYGMLQTALYSYDVKLGHVNSSGIVGESCDAGWVLEEPMRRYEVLAMLGDIQSQLNVAFLFKQRSQWCVERSPQNIQDTFTATISWVHQKLRIFSWRSLSDHWNWGQTVSDSENSIRSPVDEPMDVRDTCSDLIHAIKPMQRGSLRNETMKWLRRSIKYYKQSSDTHQVPEAQREIAYCYLGWNDWFDTCRPKSEDIADSLSPIQGEYVKVGMEYLRLASSGNDLQALASLANVLGDEQWCQQNMLPSLGLVDEHQIRQWVWSQREESRSYYKQCVQVGGYPEGLPCQLEHWMKEIVWAYSDILYSIRKLLNIG